MSISGGDICILAVEG